METCPAAICPTGSERHLLVQPLTRSLARSVTSSYPTGVSTFLLHQEPDFTVLLADSLGTKSTPAIGTRIPLTAPKIVHVAPCAYAVHAGTWQPALEMLTRSRELIAAPGAINDWSAFSGALTVIGTQVYEHYKAVFGLHEFDVRVALVLTGELRHPEDIAAQRSSTLVLWEVARSFEPVRAVGYLHFAGTKPLSDLATTILSQDAIVQLLRQSPLSCAQALVAVHALLSRISTQIGTDVNVVVAAKDTHHTVIHGTLVDLAQAAILKG